MTEPYVCKGVFPESYFAETGRYIASVQRADGSIPWFAGAVTDPWDHVEAAMGLTVAGNNEAARAAYRWLARTQRPDGSWFAAYQDREPIDRTRIESNFVAYVATGIWHFLRATGDFDFAAELWPTVRRATGYVLGLQAGSGEIAWAVHPTEGPRTDALVTGCSSIFKSLECAVAIAGALGKPGHHILAARARLGEAIRRRPERFDRTWPSKRRYSMDWFYPVLTGVITRASARDRIYSRWNEFVVAEVGCLCVSDEPWVTVAESCELAMTLLAMGQRRQATELFSWLHQFRHDDGSWWTGYVYPDQALWPDERPTWTAGAVLLAADAIAQHTPAHDLFTSSQLPDTPQNTKGLGRWARLE